MSDGVCVCDGVCVMPALGLICAVTLLKDKTFAAQRRPSSIFKSISAAL